MEPPFVVNGWKIYVWSEFAERWRALRQAVEVLRRNDPLGWVHHPEARFLEALRRVVLEQIPSDPGSERYRQGLTLGKEHRHWRRAKFLRRFRLFFRYHSENKIIIYAWLNDEDSLREAGARTDVYRVFDGMLRRGTPPSDWDALLTECEAWRQRDAG
ncbi:MAG TPA: type II toxin-antitoxin system YhaV family toxin [Longimicrobium sp.]